jgi:5-methylcytosine-specific restriction endonuclease McrA
MAANIKPQTRLNIYLDGNKECFYCGRKVKWEEFTIDHVVPRSKGGKSIRNNYVCCCTDCNSIKGDMPIEQFNKYINNLHIVMRNDPKWRLFLKHFDVKAKRKTNFLEKYNNRKKDG